MPEHDKERKDLNEHGIFYLTGEVDEDMAEEVITFILENNLNGIHQMLKIVINSGGGACSDGFAIIDAMQGSKLPVHTIGIGCLASMALNIFIAGHHGTRTLTPNTTIMSHQYSSFHYGKEHELLAHRKGDDLLARMIINHYKRYTKLKTEKEIRKHLLPPHDVWLAAGTAKKLGLCDVVKHV